MANFLNSIFMVGRRLFRKANLRKNSEFVDITQEDFLLKTGFVIPQYFISEMSEAFFEFDKVSDMIRIVAQYCTRMGVVVFPQKRWRHY